MVIKSMPYDDKILVKYRVCSHYGIWLYMAAPLMTSSTQTHAWYVELTNYNIGQARSGVVSAFTLWGSTKLICFVFLPADYNYIGYRNAIG